MTPFTKYQKTVIAILGFLQFTVILDFMIMSPLGAILMPTLNITPGQFGWVVSAYAFSAGIAGFLSAGFADRFDRKRMLLFFYTGFIAGTFLCGIVQDYRLLVGARIVTGLFGGVIGSIVFAIITDLFPFEARGRVFGVVQTAFASSQILGIPMGLYFSNHWGWHAPFLMIVAVGIVAGFAIMFLLQPIRGHLDQPQTQSAFRHLRSTLSDPWYLQAFFTTALLVTGGFMLMPFSSAFTVHNLGIGLDQLPVVYIVTGFTAMLAGPLLGRASDAFGKFRMFCIGTFLSIVMIVIYTRMQSSTLGGLILINSIMFIGITSRMISAQALVSGIPSPDKRGAFMAIQSSIQQVSGGVASMWAGWIVVESKSGSIGNFDLLGDVVVAVMVLTMSAMFFVNRNLQSKVAAARTVLPT